jgi:hypothetical protein
MRARLLLSLLFLSSLPALADQLIPAGSIIGCTVAEGKISSQTTAVGDPVMCTLNHAEKFGRTSFPYGTYLIGRFEEYKDPGHFVGKGYMELRFDRMVVQPDTIVPVNARVVATPGYKVDQEGRILGNGHAVKDTVEWLIPVLWPIDLINLPRRGPRPVLKPETQLTLKVMDDFGIPTPMENSVRTPALVSRQTPDEPTYQSYREPAPVERQAAPVQQSYAPPPQPYAPQQYAPQQYAQQQTPQVVVQMVQQPAQQQQPIYIQQQQQPIVVQQAPPQVIYSVPRYAPPPPPAYAYGPYGYRYYGPY